MRLHFDYCKAFKSGGVPWLHACVRIARLKLPLRTSRHIRMASIAPSVGRGWKLPPAPGRSQPCAALLLARSSGGSRAAQAVILGRAANSVCLSVVWDRVAAGADVYGKPAQCPAVPVPEPASASGGMVQLDTTGEITVRITEAEFGTFTGHLSPAAFGRAPLSTEGGRYIALLSMHLQQIHALVLIGLPERTIARHQYRRHTHSMARYSALLGRRIEVSYRAGDIVLPATGNLAADSGKSIFLEESYQQKGGVKTFRWRYRTVHLEAE